MNTSGENLPDLPDFILFITQKHVCLCIWHANPWRTFSFEQNVSEASVQAKCMYIWLLKSKEYVHVQKNISDQTVIEFQTLFR